MSDIGRVYQTVISAVSIGTAVQDIWSIKSGTAAGAVLHYIELNAAGQASPSQMRVRLKRIRGATVTQGSGGTAPTPVATQSGDVGKASQVTAHINDTTQGTGTTTDTLGEWQWDMVMPFTWQMPPEDRETIQAGEMFVFDLPATITAVTVSATFKWAEVP